ncbi:MAG TPA: hypothetical protein VGU23_04275 [Acidobacteriaceae bacterium]|nr:hypothetical protein [Acidobacteriaceae bacterium]
MVRDRRGLDDAGATAIAWEDKVAVIDEPIITIQLREVAALFTMADDDFAAL